MKKQRLYRLVFHNHSKIYEIYARSISSSGLYGFIEASELVFDSEDTLVVDPTEERIRDEFSDVKTLHLPAHSVVRVEEVEKRGVCKIFDSTSGDKITPFPMPGKIK